MVSALKPSEDATERWHRHSQNTTNIAVCVTIGFQIYFWAMIFTGNFFYAFVGLAINAAFGWVFLLIRNRKDSLLMEKAMDAKSTSGG